MLFSRRQVNRIAYINLDGRLCTINSDGDDERQLSEPGAVFQFPAWSPDGRFIAAIGSEPGGAGVYRFRDRDGRFRGPDQQEIYFGQVQAPLYLYWSPDSTRLGFLVGYPQSIALYLSPLKGQRESQLIETGQPFFWTWMPDGAYLFIHTGGMGEKARLNFIDQDGDDWGKNLAAPGYFQAPAISDDGRYWAFAQLDGHQHSQLVVEHHTTGDRVVIPHTGAVAMGWQPSAARLAFINPDESAQHFFGPLHVLEMDTGRVDCMVDEQVLAFFWSPNGRYIAFFTLAPQRTPLGPIRLDLHVLDPTRGRADHLCRFEPAPYFVNEFLPIFDQYAHSHRLWAPDSEALLLPVVEGRTPWLMVIGLDGRHQRVAPGIMGSWSQN